MKIHHFTLAAILTLLGAIDTAQAKPAEDRQEVTLTAGLDRQIGSGVGNFNGNFSYGHFLSDALQLGVRQGVSYTFSDDASDVWRATTVPFVDYHCPGFGEDNRYVPYVGGFAGAVWSDEDFTGTVGPQGGIKVYVDESTFLLTRYSFEWFFEDLDEVNETIDSAHVLTAGFGYNW